MKIVGIFLQTKEKYADLLKGSFFSFEANVAFEERHAKKCSSSSLGVDVNGRWESIVLHHSFSFILSFSSFPSRVCSGGFWLPALGSFLLHIFPHFYGEQFVVVRAAYVSVLALFGVETYRLVQVVCRTVCVDLGRSYHFPPIVEE